MVKKKIVEDNRETFGDCTFSQECNDKTSNGKCAWKHGCAYRVTENV